MINKTIKRIPGRSASRFKKNALKVGFDILFTCIALLANAEGSESREVPFEQAKRVIEGVINMYQQDVPLKNIKCWIDLRKEPIKKLNASYTHATKIFWLPYVLTNHNKLYSTARDQGIVAHEAGHMILHYLIPLAPTHHANAFHEAFADLTSQFYRFYNRDTRHDFLNTLKNGQGCVGDTPFTCVRNNGLSSTLQEIAHNEKLCEIHSLSTPFSNAVYNTMVTAYQHSNGPNGAGELIVTWHRQMLVKAVLATKTSSPTLMDIAQNMLKVSYSNSLYRDELGINFIKNGLIILMYYPPHIDYQYYMPNKKYAQLCREKESQEALDYFLN